MAKSPETLFRILFLTESREDYLADSLLHGLVSLGHEVTDYPRKCILYRGFNPYPTSPSDVGHAVRGGGFTLYGNLDDRIVDRSFIIQRLERQSFDLVIFGQIWRQWDNFSILLRCFRLCQWFYSMGMTTHTFVPSEWNTSSSVRVAAFPYPFWPMLLFQA